MNSTAGLAAPARTRRRGVLVYDHYYAKDTPATHQQATNVAFVAICAVAGTATRHALGRLSVQAGTAPAAGVDAASLEHVAFHDLLANCVGAQHPPLHSGRGRSACSHRAQARS